MYKLNPERLRLYGAIRLMRAGTASNCAQPQCHRIFRHSREFAVVEKWKLMV